MTTDRPNDLRARILQDPSASYWLKARIQDIDDRDPVDVANDLDALIAVNRSRLPEVPADMRAADPVKAIEDILVIFRTHTTDPVRLRHALADAPALLLALRDLQARTNPAAETPPTADQVALDRADDLARLCSRALDLRQEPLAYQVMQETVTAYYERRAIAPTQTLPNPFQRPYDIGGRHGTVTIAIHPDKLSRIMGTRASFNTTHKTRAMHGAIVAHFAPTGPRESQPKTIGR